MILATYWLNFCVHSCYICKKVMVNKWITCLNQVGVQTSRMEMLPIDSKISSWETYNEDLYSSDDSSTFSSAGLLEQINVTRDTSDYLWYTTRWAKSSWLNLFFAKVYGLTKPLFTQCWYWLVGVLSSWWEAPNSYCSVSWSCSACFCEWRAFW